MRKRSQRERARWDHYRIRGQLFLAGKILYGVMDWARRNKYDWLAIHASEAYDAIIAVQRDIPTHPSPEYLERNS